MGDPEYHVDGLKNLELMSWSLETELQNLQRIDIGLHPLPDEEWVYGKSGGKLVQYMAVGIPTIATAIGPNYDAIKEGFNGFLVNNDQGWKEKLELLITNHVLRIEMGKNVRDTAIHKYSLNSNYNKYLRIFKLLVTR